MDAMARKNVAETLRAAASALEGKEHPSFSEPAYSIEGRGPTNPKALFRYASKTNQAPLYRKTRDFLALLASAGNTLMEGGDVNMESLNNSAQSIIDELSELLDSVRELS